MTGRLLTSKFSTGLARIPKSFEIVFITQRIHRLPEPIVKVNAELAVRSQPFHRLALPHGRVAGDVVADLGRQHEEPAVDPSAIAERLLLEPGDPIALVAQRAKAARRLCSRDGRQQAAAAVLVDRSCVISTLPTPSP